MKKRFHTAILLCLLTFSFLFMLPSVKAEDDWAEPDLGDLDRIEYLDYIMQSIFDNETRLNIISNLIFDGKVAYFSATDSAVVAEGPSVENYYGLVYTGINDTSGNMVYLETNVIFNVNALTFSQDAYVHVLIWDNDKSLLTFLSRANDAFKNNNTNELVNLLIQLVAHPETVFNGDEVFIVSPIFLWRFDYDVNYAIDNQYLIDENHNGPLDEKGTSNEYDFTELPVQIQNDLKAKAGDNPNLVYLMNDTPSTNKQGTWSSFFFLIQQIWLKRLFWDWSLIGGFRFDLDLVSVRHLLVGAALYNDTDGNQLMDISFNETPDGKYYPISNEAVCSLDFINATSVDFGTPIIDNTPGAEKLSWNATLRNPYVRLTPYGQSAETGIGIAAPEIPVGDTSFGFTFSPRATQSGQHVNLEGVIKVDQTIGALNGTTGLKGIYRDLDLAILYLSDVFEVTATQQLSASVPQTNATVKDPGNNQYSPTITTTTSKTESLNFFVGSSRVTGIDLAGAKYAIGNEDPSTPSHNASGAVIPYGLYEWSIEQTGEATSQRGNVDWNLSAAVSYSTYIYEICYPDYNGSKVVHDPTYIIYGDVTYPGGIPGFEFYTIFLGLSLFGCLVIFLKKKKVSTI
ncbi:MAG: hypothetical protein ACTSRS_05425 [Candidatus Helarchaeota archaeon]